jgi:3-oxoacyl-[acyl-carrier protein] reductase
VQTGYISAENEKKESARLPLRRVGRPEDLAEAIVFLASDQASWITGQRIKVDGGCGYELK